MLLNILKCLWLLGVPALAQLPACGNAAYVDAVDKALCAFLDYQCICNSNVFASNLGQNVPYACNTTAQSTIFSYVDAACSQVGGSVFNLLATAVTDVSITASTGPATVSVTVTSTVSDAHSLSTADSSSSSNIPAPSSSGLSTGSKVGIAVGVVGGVTAILLFSFCAYRQGRAAAMMNQKNLYDNSPFMQMHGDPKHPITELSAQPKPRRHELMHTEEQVAELI